MHVKPKLGLFGDPLPIPKMKCHPHFGDPHPFQRLNLVIILYVFDKFWGMIVARWLLCCTLVQWGSSLVEPPCFGGGVKASWATGSTGGDERSPLFSMHWVLIECTDVFNFAIHISSVVDFVMEFWDARLWMNFGGDDRVLILRFTFQVHWILWWKFGCTGLGHLTSTSILKYKLHIRGTLGFVKGM